VSDITAVEQMKFEAILGMASGYVLNFTNNTFAQFVAQSTGRDIFSDTYEYGSGSKANRLRAFWKLESNHLVGTLLNDLLEVAQLENPGLAADSSFEDCKKAAARLVSGGPGMDLAAISEDLSGPEFELILRAVRESIDRDEPELGLDRLHTLTIKYVRVLAQKRGLTVDREKPLHSVFGEYVKALKASGAVESVMTERIFKSAIGTFEAFNTVRNRQTLAHDNPVLGYEESMFIFNQVCSLLRFVRQIESAQIPV
jgi:hypothetical protein